MVSTKAKNGRVSGDLIRVPVTVQAKASGPPEYEVSLEIVKRVAASACAELHEDLPHRTGRDAGEAGCGEHTTEQAAKDAAPAVARTRQQIIMGLLAFGNFCLGASISLQAPFFTHEAQVKGVSATESGFVFSVFELTIFIVAPIFGKMVAIVKPRFLLLSGLFYVGMASILFGSLKQSPPGSVFLGLAIAVRVFEGLGTAAFQTAVFSIVAAEFPKSLASTYSVQQTAFGVGLVAGPTVGGFLYQIGGFTLPFVCVGSLLLICDALAYLLLPHTENDGQLLLGSGNMLKFWCNAGILLDAYCVFTTFLIIGFNSATLEPHLRQFKLEPYLVGLVFVLNGTVYACTAWIWGKMADRTVHTKELCIIACLLFSASLLLVGPAPFIPLPTAIWSVMVALAMFGLGCGGTIVCSFVGSFRDTLKRGFPDDLSTYGLVSSVFTVAHSLGAFVGPTLGGYLLDTVGYPMGSMVLLGNDLLLMVALCVYAVTRPPSSADRQYLLKEST